MSSCVTALGCKGVTRILSLLANNLGFKKTTGLYLQQLARSLNRDSSSLFRLVKRAQKSQDLETKAEKLLQVVSSPKKENS